jgi:hypothetical protein
VKKVIVLMVFVLLAMSALVYATAEPVTLSDTDLEKWNHPSKTVFEANDIELLEVEIENKLNYTFNVIFPRELQLENEAYFDKLTKDLAKTVKFNSYKIIDDDNEITIEVTCDKNAVKDVVYNETPGFFQKLRDFAAKEKQLQELLIKQIPELKSLNDLIVKNNPQAKMVIYISAEPNSESTEKYEKEYYLVAIGQADGEERETIDQFYVHKDNNTIMWTDGEDYLTLEEWRKQYTEEPYWPDFFIK